jgi:preprotein translocase subunit SecG
MASRQEEPSEVDKGIVAFLETITAWIIMGFLILFLFIPALKLIINGP